MLKGKSREINVGLGREEKRKVPRLHEDPIIDYYSIEPIDKRICCTSLRLLSMWTRRANDFELGDQNFEYAEYEIIKDCLIRKGYGEMRAVIDDRIFR